MLLARALLAMVPVGAALACGPAPGWVEEPEEAAPAPETPPLSASEETGACAMSTPAVRLQGRMTRQQSVEGMNTLRCPDPPDPGAP